MEAIVPTLMQISELPKWARVAFAVRCARRLQNLMQEHTPVSRDFDAIVSNAIAEAELSAEYGLPTDRLAAVALRADAAHEAVQDLNTILPAMTASVACWVAKAAQYTELVSASAAHGACEAAQKFGCSAAEIQADFARLQSISRALDWDDRSPASLDLLPHLSPSPRETSSATRQQNL